LIFHINNSFKGNKIKLAMSQLIRKVNGGYEIIIFENISEEGEIIPKDKLRCCKNYWEDFPNNSISRIVLQAGIKEAEVDNEFQLYEEASQYANSNGASFFELKVEHSAAQSGNSKPQQYSVFAGARIKLYNSC